MEYLELAVAPFLACLVVASLHTWFGLHVVNRGIIFIDLALAQVAALGASIGLLLEFEIGTLPSYLLSLVLTVLCSWLFVIIRHRVTHISIEAYIGITYAAAAAVSILVLDRTSEGAEHLKNFMVGSILTVSWTEIFFATGSYGLIAFMLYVFRGRIANGPEPGVSRSALSDFLFYLAFGITVTISVKMLGVLLVFSFLIIPAVGALLYTRKFRPGLVLGWIISAMASVLGLILSFTADLPTGASIIVAFVIILGLLHLKKVRA